MSFSSQNTLLLTSSSKEDERRILTNKVRAMAALPEGFSHGEGIPVERAAIARAEELISLAWLWELDADVFPNVDGGCAVAFYKNERKVEASVRPEGNTFDIRVEQGIGFQFKDVVPPAQDASLDAVFEQVYQLSLFDQEIWKLSESSTSASLIEEADDSETSSIRTLQSVQRLILQTVRGGSQSSMLLVPA